MHGHLSGKTFGCDLQKGQRVLEQQLLLLLPWQEPQAQLQNLFHYLMQHFHCSGQTRALHLARWVGQPSPGQVTCGRRLSPFLFLSPFPFLFLCHLT